MPSKFEDHQFTSVVALSATDSDVSLKAAVSGWSIHITDISITMGATAGQVTLQDSDNTTVFGPIRMAADTNFAVKLHTPIKVAQGLALEFDKEAGADEGSVFVAGYLDKEV